MSHDREAAQALNCFARESLTFLRGAVADPGFTAGGFRTVMRAMRARKILGATPTLINHAPKTRSESTCRGHVAT